MQNSYTTPPPDIPPALARILTSSAAPAYQAGGMIGPGGMPDMSGMHVGVNSQTVGQSGVMSPQMLEMQVNQFVSQYPQQVAQIQAVIQEVMATGELTQQELNMIIQLATVAAQNPEMYPYVRKFAIQNGIATEQDLPSQYDQGLVFALLVAARAIQAGQQGSTSVSVPSMAVGGAVPPSKNPDGSVLINAHEGEYVIPAHVVKMKGKEFFDNLVEKYK